MNKIGIVCGSFHEKEIKKMLEFARDEANNLGLEISKERLKRNLKEMVLFQKVSIVL